MSQSKYDKAKEDIKGGVDKTKEDIKGATEKIKDDVQTGTDKTKHDVKTTTEKTKEDIKIATDKTKQDVKETTDKTKQDVKDVTDKTKQDVKDVTDKTKQDFKDTKEKTKEDIKDTTGKMKEDASSGIEKAKEDIKSGTEKLKQDVQDVTSSSSYDKTKQDVKETTDKAKQDIKGKMDKTKEDLKIATDKTKQDVKDAMDKAKQSMSDTQQKVEDRLSLPGLLRQARRSLQEFLNPDLEIEEQIPFKILSGAKGVVFLTVVKGGIGLGGAFGTGIVIARADFAQGWTGPCAIGMAGIQWGFNIGVQKTEHIIVLRDDEAIKTFTGKGQLKFGADASLAIGPKGRDAAVAVSVNDKGYAPTASYSMAQGAYIGVSLEGQIMAVRNECNDEFYQQKTQPSKILDGSIKPPQNDDWNALCRLLDEYTKRQGQSVKDLFKNLDDEPKPNEDKKQDL